MFPCVAQLNYGTFVQSHRIYVWNIYQLIYLKTITVRPPWKCHCWGAIAVLRLWYAPEGDSGRGCNGCTVFYIDNTKMGLCYLGSVLVRFFMWKDKKDKITPRSNDAQRMLLTSWMAPDGSKVSGRQKTIDCWSMLGIWSCSRDLVNLVDSESAKLQFLTVKAHRVHRIWNLRTRIGFGGCSGSHGVPAGQSTSWAENRPSTRCCGLKGCCERIVFGGLGASDNMEKQMAHKRFYWETFLPVTWCIALFHAALTIDPRFGSISWS